MTMFKIKGSIRNKLILFLLIATVVPIVTSIVITYHYTKESVKKSAIRENLNLMFQGKTNLTHYLDLIVKSGLVVYSEAKLYNIVQAGYRETSDEANELVRTLQQPYRAVNEVHQVHLDLEHDSHSFLFINDLLKTNVKAAPESAPKPAPPAASRPAGAYEPYLEGTHLSHNYGVNYFPYYAPQYVFSIHRPIYRIPSTERIGTLSVDVKLNFIQAVCEQLFNKAEEQLYLLDDSGVIVYSGNREEWGLQADREWASHIREQSASQGYFEWKEPGFNGMQIFQKIEIAYANWTIVKRIPYAYLYQNARELTTINVAVYSLFLIVTIAATVFISLSFTAPIKRLIGTINKIQTGNLNADIAAQGNDEFGILARRFRLMMQTINELILREYSLQLTNKTNELKALQAQINPHFLGNALQSIGTLALQNGETQIYSLISSLGKMMRYTMNTNETIVPLARELDYVKAYLDLQKQRFAGQLDVQFAIAPETQAVDVPKMMLQPLVENVFKHGFAGSGEGRIRICCIMEADGWLRIAVEDNGKGMTEEELRKLSERIEQSPAISSDPGVAAEQIGLYNVASRLKLYFDERANMRIEHATPKGLNVILHIPVKKEGSNHESADS